MNKSLQSLVVLLVALVSVTHAVKFELEEHRAFCRDAGKLMNNALPSVLKDAGVRLYSPPEGDLIVTVHTLKCIKKEDKLWDDPMVQIVCDGRSRGQFQYHVMRNSVRNVERSFAAKYTCRVMVWDADTVYDDLIGDVVLEKDLAPRTFTLKRYGAEYELRLSAKRAVLKSSRGRVARAQRQRFNKDPNMRMLRLKTIKCVDKDDSIANDQIYLKVTCDGKVVHNNDMRVFRRANQRRRYNLAFWFSSSCTIQLNEDAASGALSNLVGTHTVRTSSTGRSTVRLNQAGDYRVAIEVLEGWTSKGRVGLKDIFSPSAGQATLSYGGLCGMAGDFFAGPLRTIQDGSESVLVADPVSMNLVTGNFRSRQGMERQMQRIFNHYYPNLASAKWSTRIVRIMHQADLEMFAIRRAKRAGRDVSRAFSEQAQNCRGIWCVTNSHNNNLANIMNDAPADMTYHMNTATFIAATSNRLSSPFMVNAATNLDHFNDSRARDVYDVCHTLAMREAKNARGAGSASAKREGLIKALLMNSHCDHFLTDLFSAGHLRSKRYRTYVQRHRLGCERGMLTTALESAGAAAKMEHDEDNYFGLPVKNRRGKRWRAYGDAKAFDTEPTGLGELVGAVVRSIRDVLKAFSDGTVAGPFASRVYDYLPDIDTTNVTAVHPELFSQPAGAAPGELYQYRESQVGDARVRYNTWDCGSVVNPENPFETSTKGRNDRKEAVLERVREMHENLNEVVFDTIDGMANNGRKDGRVQRHEFSAWLDDILATGALARAIESNRLQVQLIKERFFNMFTHLNRPVLELADFNRLISFQFNNPQEASNGRRGLLNIREYVSFHMTQIVRQMASSSSSQRSRFRGFVRDSRSMSINQPNLHRDGAQQGGRSLQPGQHGQPQGVEAENAVAQQQLVRLVADLNPFFEPVDKAVKDAHANEKVGDMTESKWLDYLKTLKTLGKVQSETSFKELEVHVARESERAKRRNELITKLCDATKREPGEQVFADNQDHLCRHNVSNVNFGIAVVVLAGMSPHADDASKQVADQMPAKVKVEIAKVALAEKTGGVLAGPSGPPGPDGAPSKSGGGGGGGGGNGDHAVGIGKIGGQLASLKNTALIDKMGAALTKAVDQERVHVDPGTYAVRKVPAGDAVNSGPADPVYKASQEVHTDGFDADPQVLPLPEKPTFDGGHKIDDLLELRRNGKNGIGVI
eukprot:TRINITY_DN66156_c5_g1_i1.p1 TRINITY_DN66156_c5_g1~~TRINITY_DN66156_c5_g1_i1.p1  ORF type:complete len:1201 (-),score=716.89 TRINITY_DN66156_c5_g1_i1:210-3812(-)